MESERAKKELAGEKRKEKEERKHNTNVTRYADYGVHKLHGSAYGHLETHRVRSKQDDRPSLVSPCRIYYHDSG